MTGSRLVPLAGEDDFAGWRDGARAALAEGLPPDQIVWSVAGEGGDLFATPAPMWGAAEPLRISRHLLSILRMALLHSDPRRFDIGYRLLWRMRAAPHLASDPTDPDVRALEGLARAVRRDIHKMHAFVRFRKMGEADGRERFAAWFEPQHHVVRAAAGFFRDRFASMDWLIVTPEASIAWDGARLASGPGGTRADVPGDDAVEAEWLAYYASIFNPARLMVDAMRKEMPKLYWRNLPEAALIAGLVEGAQQRVEAMVADRQDALPLIATPAPEEGRRFPTLDALYAALRTEDEAPSEGFSDHVVCGEGPAHAPLLFVGEQPGEQEDLAGRPFVGPAGQLLDHCLAEAGIARDRAFLTNAVKRFKFTHRGKRRLHATPNAGDITHYRWWLAEEVRLVAPHVVVALGATALQALTGRRQPLASLRGALHPWQDRQLLVTAHPSYLLRLPDAQGRAIERGKFLRDLALAASAAA